MLRDQRPGRPGSDLIPELAVVNTPGVERTVAEPADVALVVEITSPGNAVVDRALKPTLYARAGIPNYLLIELGAELPTAVVFPAAPGSLRAGAAGGSERATAARRAIRRRCRPLGPGHRHPPTEPTLSRLQIAPRDRQIRAVGPADGPNGSVVVKTPVRLPLSW